MQKTREVYFYTNRAGKSDIKQWLEKLDVQNKARILNRITRLEYGIYGDHKNIQGKLFELRFFFGSGYRLYFIEEQDKIIILLNGGDKSSQQNDIKKAKKLMNKYIEDKND